jgi:hypothetical protein
MVLGCARNARQVGQQRAADQTGARQQHLAA